MADEATASDQEFLEDGTTPNPDYVKPKEGSEEGEADPEKKDGEEGEGEGQEKSFDDSATPEVPVRNSAASEIIARKDRKIKKLQSEKDKPKEGEEGYVPPSDDGSLSEEAQTAVSDEVSKQTKPIIDRMVTDADSNELSTFLKDTPDAKKYEKHIKAYMSHESYKGVPPSVIYHHLAFTNAQALGAKKKDAADLEANQSKSGGRATKLDTSKSVDGLPTAQAITDMTEEEFQNLEDDAIQGKFVNK